MRTSTVSRWSISQERICFDRSEPDIGLCVAADSPLRTADIEGQTIAVGGLKDGTDLALHAYLIDNKVDVSKVRIIEMPFPRCRRHSSTGPLQQQ